MSETVHLPEIPKYRILRKLGSGGMATVFLANQEGFDRLVALKLMTGGGTSEEQFKARFYREARTVGQLQHAAITPVYDFGEHQGQPYLAMRYLSGGDLADRLAGGPMAPDEALGLLRTLVKALAFAHREGVVHRDIKPENILFDDEGNALVADFGIARRMAESSSLTQGYVIGSPRYMSPEQMVGEECTPASDFYSLGVVFWEMLTGNKAFDEDTWEAIYRSKLPPGALPLPRTLEAYRPLLERLVAPRAQDRYHDPDRICADIDALRGRAEGAPAGRAAVARRAALLVIALLGLGFTVYRVYTGPAPVVANIGAALTTSPDGAGVYLLPDLQALDRRTQLTGGDYRAFAWSPGFRARPFGFSVPLSGALSVSLPPVAEPAVAEFHDYLDLVDSGDPGRVRKFRADYPDSPLTSLALARVDHPDLSLDELRAAAQVGDVVAQVNYGELLEQGWAGVAKNRSLAFTMARRAADAGYAFGQYQYALQLFDQGDRTAEGLENLEAAAEQGFFLAQNLLGRLLAGGEWTEQDLERGMTYLQRAADQGYREALFNLGVLYMGGRGVAADPERAAGLLRQAADLGDPQARDYLRNG